MTFRRCALLTCLLLGGAPSTGQAQSSQLPVAPQMRPDTNGFNSALARRAALEHSAEPSQFTFVGGDLGHSGRTHFEGVIVPHLFGGTDRWALIFTPKIIVRMRADESATVRGPSYMPRLTWQGLRWASERHVTIHSVTLSHHSNGQGGPFYADTTFGIINLENGSFSTNFLEYTRESIRLTSESEYSTWRVGARVHIPLNEDPELRNYRRGDDQYGRFRLLAGGVQRLWRVRLAGGLEYMVDPKVKTSRFFSHHRVVAHAGAAMIVPGFRDTGLFAHWFYGQDYYNINYTKQLNVVRAGLTLRSVSNVRWER